MAFNRIRIRDDDVLTASTRWPEPVRRFKGFHNLVCQDTEHFIHVCAILCTEILAYPEAIDLIKAETAAGRIEPQIHGWIHEDYGKKPSDVVRMDLWKCKEFIKQRFDFEPTLWYTPWGASQPHLHMTAETMGLKLIDTSNVVHPGPARDYLKAHPDELDVWQGKEILRHWWESVGALDEFVRTYKRLADEKSTTMP